GEQEREFDPVAPVRVGRETGDIGQLAEPRAVRAHGEDLVAEGIRAERIARSVEDDCLRHRILTDELIPHEAVRRRIQIACRLSDGAPWVEVCDLAQPAAERVNGEYLAVSRGVRPERVGGCPEEGARPGSVQERAERVNAVEVCKLNEIILADLDEDLGDREVASRKGVRRNTGQGQVNAGGRKLRDSEDRTKPAAWRADRRGDGLEHPAVDLDREASKVMLRV